MNKTIPMHVARTALNRDDDLRDWAENWLKERERAQHPAMPDADFEKRWRMVRPERMHEGAVEAVTAYRQQNDEH